MLVLTLIMKSFKNIKMDNIELGYVISQMLETKVVEVWFCKTLQHVKGIFYAPAKELFIEATFDGDDELIHLDYYKKVKHGVFVWNVEKHRNQDKMLEI